MFVSVTGSVHAKACVWRLEDNLRVSFLFLPWALEIKLRFSDLVTGVVKIFVVVAFSC